MNDTLLMSGLECLRNLMRNLERFFRGNRSAFDALGQRFAFDKLHHQEVAAINFLYAVNRCDIRMIQGCQDAGFTLESRNTIGIVAERFGKELDRDTTSQLRIGSLIDIAHSAGSDVTSDLVMCEF